jgi:hypothetical protein
MGCLIFHSMPLLDFIEPITCSSCGKKGRPGDMGFISHGWFVTCQACEQKMEMQNPRDQNILANNKHGRIYALSNHEEKSSRKSAIGKSEKINFAQPFDYVGFAGFTPRNQCLVDYFNPYNLDPIKDHMIILTSEIPGSSGIASEIEYNYSVVGLVNAQNLPSWYILFYNAMSNLAYHRQYRTAFLEYSMAFEAFIEQFLVNQLTTKYDVDTAEYLIDKTKGRIDERVKQLLKLAIGHMLSEKLRVYQPWDENVRKPRNQLIHGNPVPIGKEEAEKAHQATYQAIRWIQRLVNQEMPLDNENLCCSNILEPGRAMTAVKAWGSAVGTGRPQAIKHGLSHTPSRVYITPSDSP